MRRMNRALAKLRAPVELRKRFDHHEDMVSLEQVANFELLIHELIEHGVAGSFVELGCYVGNTAAVIGRLLKDLDPQRAFHVYDSFDIELGRSRGIRAQFEARMRKEELPLPVIHAGNILDLLPGELPERIAFAHIDLGTGSSVDGHAALMKQAISAVYERLTPEGILCLMDYHSPGRTLHGNDSNPGVREAADTFFRDRPELIHLLYGGPCSHAYVRKR